MKFAINRSELLKALTVVSKAATSRSTLPVLAGVLVKADLSSLTLETTDLERAIRCTVPAFIEEEGVAVIPQKLLQDIVKSLPEAAVSVEADASGATISCDRTSFSLKTLDPEDFPAFPSIEVDNKITVPFKPFSQAIKKVAKVVSKDQSRAVLTGVLLSTMQDGMRLVATDSYRLAMADIDVAGAAEGFEAIVSGPFLQEIASLPDTAEEIDVCLSANQVAFMYDSVILLNRRIEGRFPNYKQLIPPTFGTRTEFDTQDLLNTVKRVGLMSNLAAPIKFDILADPAGAMISAMSQDVGSAQETVACAVEGKDVQIALNHAYVMDGLTSISTEKVYLETESSMRPGIFKSGEGDTFLYLLMPVRIS